MASQLASFGRNEDKTTQSNVDHSGSGQDQDELQRSGTTLSRGKYSRKNEGEYKRKYKGIKAISLRVYVL